MQTATDERNRRYGMEPNRFNRYPQDGTFTPDTSGMSACRHSHCPIGGYKSDGSRQVYTITPWTEDFEAIELEKIPTHWIGATGKFFVREKDGNKILVKPPPQRGLDRSNVYIGPSTMKDYQIQVDLMGTRNKHRVPVYGAHCEPIYVGYAG